MSLTEKSFPVVCTECLGDEQYLTFYRSTMDSQCKMCTKIYTGYRIEGGEYEAKSKTSKTVICKTCSVLKNICQICLMDLEFHVPGFVRDSMKEDAHRELKLNETTIQYDKMRKLAFRESLRNEHLLEDGKKLLTYQSKRFHPYKKALAARKLNCLEPPQDIRIKSFIVGPIPKGVTQEDIRKNFEPYGPIRDFVWRPKERSCLVAFGSRSDAEICAEVLYKKLTINNEPINFCWAKRKKAIVRKKEEISSIVKVPTFKPDERVLKYARMNPKPPLPPDLPMLYPNEILDINQYPTWPHQNDQYQYQTIKSLNHQDG